jgi:hypothetical protein
MSAYDPANVERVSGAIYRAAKRHDGVTWAAFKRHAEEDEAAKTALNHWYAVGIAALDMAVGASARLTP